MKTRILAFVISIALCSGARAQLDKILAPVAVAQDASQPVPVVALNGTVIGASPVKRVSHALTSDEILPLLEKQLTEHFSLEGELKLGLSAQWRRITVPADYEVTITDFPGGALSGSFIVRCKITADAETIADLQLPLRAQLWREVLVAEGRLDRGQTLDRSLVAAQKVDVLRERESLLSADVDPALYEVAQGVAAGRPLSRRDVAERPLIHKGEIVEVIASQGAFNVSMKALALENGVARALIKMRNIESNKNFTAQVINENQVQVHF
jgi:flagella basal body P-ring formation protein FlgA